MDPVVLAIVGLIVGFIAFQLAYLAGLERGRRDRAEALGVIDHFPTTFDVPPAPYRAEGDPK